jgi:xanthine dehydrogenase accessory factor
MASDAAWSVTQWRGYFARGQSPIQCARMILNNVPLPEFFLERKQRGEPLVLATIVETIGSTYRKAGAQMLIAQGGEAAGLLSGGCAESDLIERAQRVLQSGKAELAEFDTRGSDDVIWGIGLGCEGAMRILLTRIDAANDYEPYNYILISKRQHARGAYALSIASGVSQRLEQETIPVGIRQRLVAVLESNQARVEQVNGEDIFFAPVELPPRVLVLGAGADAAPVVEFAARLGWLVTVADHRPAYAVADRFPRAHAMLLSPAAELSKRIAVDDFDAAIVMSHHLPTDQTYLAMLADSRLRYVGLLGPANRRARLLAEIGDRAERLKSRLAGPIGLDIGAQSPEAIALAIVAEIHAYLQGRSGGSFSGMLPRG